MTKPKVISIVGPTAAGKTSLSIKIAQQFNGEVISADSRQVYKGLDLGSGKVTKEEMDGVPHYLLDVADPMTVYTAADFKRDATAALENILEHQKLPIVAGGTFFYVDTLLGKISSPEVAPNERLRAELAQKTNEQLFTLLQSKNPERAATIDKHNQRRLIRALEIVEALGSVPTSTPEQPYDVLTIGTDIDKEQLHENIHVRLLERFEDSMLEEVQNLLESGVSHERLEDLGLEYRYISRHIRGELSYEDMLTELETKIRQFAKRQYTWLKRDGDIIWLNPKDTNTVFSTVSQFLTN